MVDSRNKGATFERLIATRLRETFPHAVVRRSRQAEGAYESDVVTQGSEFLERMWWELTHSNNPNPAKKMDQALCDIVGKGDKLPVVVWRKTGSRSINVTLHYETLQEIGCLPKTMLTLDFDHLLSLLADHEQT